MQKIDFPVVKFESLCYFDRQVIINAMRKLRDIYVNQLAGNSIPEYPYICIDICKHLPMSLCRSYLQGVRSALLDNMNTPDDDYIEEYGLDGWSMVKHNRVIHENFNEQQDMCNLFQLYKDFGVVDKEQEYSDFQLKIANTKVRIEWLNQMIEQLEKEDDQNEVSL